MDEEKKTISRRDMLKYMGVAGAAVTASSPLPIIVKYITPNPDWPPEKGETPRGPVNLGPVDEIAPYPTVNVFNFNFGKVALPGMLLRMQSPPSHQKIGSTEGSGKDISGGEGYAGVPPEIIAYAMKCTHLGCIIETEFKEPNVLECPCHFARYNLSKGAAVVGGPAPAPPPEIALEIVDGELIATGWRDVEYVKSLAAYKAVIIDD
ncbi:arsenite oxidase subunit AioB precursor [archaeon BMS3Bbin16]|nr:arsenite oxidase subunit AioB precursor [archaeon BMS3Bbin16]